ncbi:hypothetical protein [Sphingomonas sp. S-NIH.Pt15_0812]|uniref:hypothetical protein n=1 Tax=Sphingomonas sp. S-NIH.Pt15_0812 TaxID=1920129 RepID=UPI000F7F7EAC|nr:hypothetical protein [Sphingomonas sp. S-NIH.Pt15_0812]
MIVTTALLLVTAQLVPAAPQTPDADEVIVLGRRAEKGLTDCLQRQCPPAEDVEASLQAAVEQFGAGRYADAHRTLQKAIHRNKKHAAELPGPVSSLYATLATVAEHEGYKDLWKHAGRQNVVLLREHLGATTPATLTEEIRRADDMLGLGLPDVAEDIYKKVQRLALANDHRSIAAAATYRRAWLALMRNRYAEADKLVRQGATIAGPSQPAMNQVRDVLLARIANRRGDKGAIEALATRLRQSATQAPTLLSAPPVEDINPPPGISDRYDRDPVRWADIGYWIRPDGHTADVEMLRTTGLSQWRVGIVRHVSARRYVPLALDPNSPGIYRIDRFTVRANFGVPLGSRIPSRMGPLTVHVVDLTETNAMIASRGADSGR